MSAVKQSEIAKVLGLTNARVSQLKSKGMPTNSIDLAAAWYRENIDQKLSPKLSPSTVPPAAKDSAAAALGELYDLHQARAKREHHEANLAELKERQALGELVDASRVRRAVTTWAATARSAFEKIADKLATRLAVESDESICHALITAEIDMVLTDLANGARDMRLQDDGRS